MALPVRLGGLGVINPSQDADLQHQVSRKTTAPLVEKIDTPDDAVVNSLLQFTFLVPRLKNTALIFLELFSIECCVV